MNETEDRLARLRQREAKLVEELQRTPTHRDRLDCLARTREMIARVAEAPKPKVVERIQQPFTVRLVPVPTKPVAPAPVFLTRRQELVERYLAYVAQGGR